MKYQPGDKILVLHSKEEGTVVDVINDKMVLIEVDKVRFPVYMDQIDFPYFTMFTEKKSFVPPKQKQYVDNIKKEKNALKQAVSKGVWLCFLPVFNKDVFEDDIVETFKLYLINQTDKGYHFIYNVNYLNGESFDLTNEVLPLSEFYIHDILFENLNDSPKFSFEFSLLTPEKNKAEYYEASVKLKAKQLFKKIEESRLNNQPTFSYILFEDYPDKSLFDKPEAFTSNTALYNIREARSKLEPARSVIDIHIEKLSDDWKRLSNFEILSLQLKTFEKFYELAVAHRQPKLIVIHGVGTGKLKDEVHEILKYKKEVKSFINQYHPAFGYGATEIFFEYK